MSKQDNRLNIQEGKLFIKGKEIETEYPVFDAFQEDEKIIVLFDPDSKMETFGQFQNLVAIDGEGHKVWVAQLPTTTSGDRYYQISSKKPLIADSIYSYSCEIDIQTGHIKQKVFYK